MRRSILVLLSGAALLQGAASMGQTPAAAGADAQSFQLEEITVTARKREEALENVPVAVAVVGGAELQNFLANDLTAIGELVPQVSMSQGGSGTGAVITVRGVSSGSNDAGLDQSVAIEVDGVPISRGQIMSASTFDLKQVQVLEGPQALFFGKNSPAGVIALTSADPTDKYEAYVTPGYEFVANQRILEAAVSGPITSTLKVRVAFRGSRMGGWLENDATPVDDFIHPGVIDPGATMGNFGPQEERYAARLTLLWTPTDDFDAKFKFTKNVQNMNGGNITSEPFCTNTTEPYLLGPLVPTTPASGVPLNQSDCQKNMRDAISSLSPTYAANFPYANGGVPYFESDFTLASLALDKKFDAVTLNSTTGYYQQTVTQASVSDWSQYATIFFAGREDYTLVTQELRANTALDGPVNFMGGVYYEHFDRPFSNAPDLFHTFNATADNYTSVDMVAYSHGQYYSGFGQARWDIIPTVELAAGARYSHDEKNSSIVNYADNYPGLYPSNQALRSDYSDSNVSPEATLSWHPLPDQTLYAAYKTGYKSGGISNAYLVYANATPDNIQFQPEKSRGEEIGYKANMLDHRLRFDVTAYRYKYNDLQVVSYNATTIDFTIGNAASALIQGVEGNVQWLVTEQLTLRGNIGFNHARYQSFSNAQCYEGQTVATGCVDGAQNLAGQPLLRAPNLTYALGADYKVTLAPDLSAALSLQGNYSSSFQTATDYSPLGYQPGFWLLDASLRVAYRDKYELAFLGRDLTDSYYTLNTVGWSGSDNRYQYVGFFNRPREMVLQATARF